MSSAKKETSEGVTEGQCGSGCESENRWIIQEAVILDNSRRRHPTAGRADLVWNMPAYSESKFLKGLSYLLIFNNGEISYDTAGSWLVPRRCGGDSG